MPINRDAAGAGQEVVSVCGTVPYSAPLPPLATSQLQHTRNPGFETELAAF